MRGVEVEATEDEEERKWRIMKQGSERGGCACVVWVREPA